MPTEGSLGEPRQGRFSLLSALTITGEKEKTSDGYQALYHRQAASLSKAARSLLSSKQRRYAQPQASRWPTPHPMSCRPDLTRCSSRRKRPGPRTAEHGLRRSACQVLGNRDEGHAVRQGVQPIE